MLYSFYIGDYVILFASVCAVFFGLTYCIIFWQFSKTPKPPRIILFLVIMSINLIGILCVSIYLGKERGINFLGLTSMISSLFLSFSPLSVLTTMVKEQTLEGLRPEMSATILINAVCWIIYGAVKEDIFIWLPNGQKKQKTQRRI